jgi:hypothetical protein
VLRRAYGAARAGTCSAKVCFGQARATEESTNTKVNQHGAATHWFARNPAAIAAVDPAGAAAAGWAAGRRCASMGFNVDNTVQHQQTLNPQTLEMWKQHRKLQQRPSSAPPRVPEHEKIYWILAPRFTKSVPESGSSG